MARIVVAMSGGVDSSVVAYLLKKAGHEVIGVTIYIKENPDDKYSVKKCCSIADILKAKNIARRLDIPHYILNLKKEFKKEVIDYFIESYQNGITPNPCIKCNKTIKFGELLRHARRIEAEYIATGHYAIVEFNKEKNRYLLKRAEDRDKDQSYFLYILKQGQLKYMQLPLGTYASKQEVKEIASIFDESYLTKQESQDVCFIPGNDYREFLKNFLPEKPGPFILKKTGEIIGQHKGYYFYNIGQRKGLGISWAERLYVTGIVPEKNEILLGPLEDAMCSEFDVADLNFIYFDRPPKKFVCLVQVRYKSELITAEVEIRGRYAHISLEKPAFAVTPGQSAVFYDLKNEYVLGGGIIK